MKKTFLNELWLRVKSETPSFFNRLKIFGGSLSVTGASLKAIEGLPATIDELSGYMIVTGAVMAAVSQLTIKHPGQP